MKTISILCLQHGEIRIDCIVEYNLPHKFDLTWFPFDSQEYFLPTTLGKGPFFNYVKVKEWVGNLTLFSKTLTYRGRPKAPLHNSKNTGAWKGRLKRFFVNPYTVELAKNGTSVI